MIRCIAIDDEPKALEVIKNHTSRIDFLILEASFVDPFKAIAYINQNSIDLVFLDINMPDISGIQLIKHLTTNPMLIFTTAHNEYAVESYELKAVDYLLKPFDFSRFLLAITKAKEKLEKESVTLSTNFFFVNTGTQRRRLFYHEISHIAGEGNYVNYFTKSDKIMVRSSIKETLQSLPDTIFMQIHRSYIIALPWIEKIKDNHIYIGEHQISIGATYRDHFMEVIDALKR